MPAFGNAIDPDEDQVSAYLVHWGDGFSDEYTATGNVTHTYGNGERTFSISVDLQDEDGVHTGASTLLVNIGNIKPTVAAGEDQAVKEGQPVQLAGTFFDPGFTDTHTAVIAVVTLTDDDGGTAVQSTTALITGVGLNDGGLQIIGTVWKDNVHVKAKGRGHDRVEVKAGFIPDRGHKRIFPADDINRIEILLGEGNDKAKISRKIDEPLFMDGGPGNDDLKAGNGDAVLYGGAGNDKLYGGQGNDLLNAGL